MNSGMLLRLAFCLVLLYGYGHVSSEEMHDPDKAIDPAEPNEEQIEGSGRTADRIVARAAGGDDKKVEGDGKDAGKSVTGGGEAPELAGEGAGDAVDEAGEVFGNVGECVGYRFKKCR